MEKEKMEKEFITDFELLFVIDRLLSEIELFSVAVVLEEHTFLQISNRLDNFNDALDEIKSSIKSRSRQKSDGKGVISKLKPIMKKNNYSKKWNEK